MRRAGGNIDEVTGLDTVVLLEMRAVAKFRYMCSCNHPSRQSGRPQPFDKT